MGTIVHCTLSPFCSHVDRVGTFQPDDDSEQTWHCQFSIGDFPPLEKSSSYGENTPHPGIGLWGCFFPTASLKRTRPVLEQQNVNCGSAGLSLVLPANLQKSTQAAVSVGVNWFGHRQAFCCGSSRENPPVNYPKIRENITYQSNN
jgi:hypothetical protein